MRRAKLVLLTVVLLCGSLVIGSLSMAQDATPAASEEHPLVGAWLFDNAEVDPEIPYTTDFFYADGMFLTVDDQGSPSGGVWEETGPNTANLTFWILEGAAKGVVPASIDVSEDGQSLTATYTFEYIAPDGMGTGQIGPGTIEGTKLAVEPQGTPVGSFEDLFGAPPEATPAN